MARPAHRIGLIADTHGLMRPEALAHLAGSDAIVHAGDIGSEAVLQALRAIAPLHAIRGNNDTQPWAANLPDSLAVVVAGVRIFVVHDAKTLDRFVPPQGTQVVVCGHSHKALVHADARGWLLVNPGSAGPRRFKLPLTVAELRLDASGSVAASIANL